MVNSIYGWIFDLKCHIYFFTVLHLFESNLLLFSIVSYIFKYNISTWEKYITNIAPNIKKCFLVLYFLLKYGLIISNIPIFVKVFLN